MKTKEQCLGIAARIWCDQDMKNEVMVPWLAEAISDILYEYFNSDAE